MRDALDACLTRTFRDVAVPEGLAERLLAGLAVDSPDGGADLPVCRTHRSLSGRQECLPHYRRWLLLAGGLAAAAAAIILAVWLGGRGGESISEESARNEAIRLFDADAGQPGSALPAANATTDYPISSYVRSFPAPTWRHVRDFLGCSGVVYNLSVQPGARAALYVVACDNAAGLDPSPAKDGFRSASSRCCASAWQENGLLYVLVVEGEQSNYQQYLNPPSSPVV